MTFDIQDRKGLLSALASAELPLVVLSFRTGEIDVDGLKVSPRVANSAIKAGLVRRHGEDSHYATWKPSAARPNGAVAR